MQDVVYFDESNEEVTEVNPLNLPPLPNMPLESITPTATSLSLPLDTALSMCSELTRDIASAINGKDAKNSEVARSISSSITVKDDKTSEVTRSISSPLTGKGAK